ncbi:MAG: ribulose-phosphate 3-epimerase, partial [Anaerolineales bacterium]
MSVKIAASILSADFAKLGEQVQEAIEAGAEYIHVDIMDGHFVPNMTMGPVVVSAIKPITQAAGVVLDVHLMIEAPDRLVPAFAEAGADVLIVHVETCPHLHRTVQLIKELGVKAGVTLNPSTSLTTIAEILPYIDQVLVMSVNPGFGNQTYIPTTTAKIARVRQMLEERKLSQVEIEVDGGLKADNVAEVV